MAHTNIDQGFIDDELKARLELFFANTNLSEKQRDEVLAMLKSSFEFGQLVKQIN